MECLQAQKHKALQIQFNIFTACKWLKEDYKIAKVKYAVTFGPQVFEPKQDMEQVSEATE